MKGRLAALIVPASVAGVALGATTAGYKGGMISAGVFFWLWPCLVAVLWLALAFGALVMRWTKWAWPPLAAFVAQLVGLLLLVSRTIKTPLRPARAPRCSSEWATTSRHTTRCWLWHAKIRKRLE